MSVPVCRWCGRSIVDGDLGDGTVTVLGLHELGCLQRPRSDIVAGDPDEAPTDYPSAPADGEG